MKDIIPTVLYIIMTLAMVGLIWFVGSFAANKLKKLEVVEPEAGVHCVVVSRMFNTSVDCWKIES